MALGGPILEASVKNLILEIGILRGLLGLSKWRYYVESWVFEFSTQERSLD